MKLKFYERKKKSSPIQTNQNDTLEKKSKKKKKASHVHLVPSMSTHLVATKTISKNTVLAERVTHQRSTLAK